MAHTSRSMNSYGTLTDMINDIKLEVRNDSTPQSVLFVLVEGDSDVRFFRKFFRGNDKKIRHVSGVEGLLNVFRVLKDEEINIIAIRDADFLRLNGQDENLQEGVFITDCHDVEMMIVSCDRAFESVAKEHTDSGDVRLRDALLEAASYPGAARWLNDTEDIGLNFGGAKITTYFAIGRTDTENFVNEIHRNSPNRTREISAGEVEQKRTTTNDYFNLCQGHDFCALFADLSELSKKPNRNDIGGDLRVAYGFGDFQETQLYRELLDFEQSSGLKIF